MSIDIPGDHSDLLATPQVGDHVSGTYDTLMTPVTLDGFGASSASHALRSESSRVTRSPAGSVVEVGAADDAIWQESMRDPFSHVDGVQAGNRIVLPGLASADMSFGFEDTSSVADSSKSVAKSMLQSVGDGSQTKTSLSSVDERLIERLDRLETQHEVSLKDLLPDRQVLHADTRFNRAAEHPKLERRRPGPRA